MAPTRNGDAPTRRVDEPELTILIDVIDPIMKAKGFESVAAQAEAFDLARTHWFNIRSGRVKPNLTTAMRISAVLGIPVDAFYRRAA